MIQVEGFLLNWAGLDANFAMNWGFIFHYVKFLVYFVWIFIILIIWMDIGRIQLI